MDLLVTRRALIQRIQRKLARQARRLKIFHSSRVGALGRYCVINLRTNTVDAADIDVEDLARALEVLEPWEVYDAHVFSDQDCNAAVRDSDADASSVVDAVCAAIREGRRS